jgi:hypothetical protein
MRGATLFTLTRNKKELVLSENQVEKQICEFLGAYGWHAMRNHVGPMVPYAKCMDAIETGALGKRDVIEMNTEGTADWVFFHANYTPLWVEVKRKGKKPTDKQLKFLRERRFMKQFAVWTDRFEDFRDWYEEYVIPTGRASVEAQGADDLRAYVAQAA